MNEKEHFFYKRTMAHIHRVQNNALYLVTECWDKLRLQDFRKQRLIWRVMAHDQSKFSPQQFDTYVEFTWAKKEGIELDFIAAHFFKQAWANHQREERRHHPYVDGFVGPTYALTDFVEMACDLQAMSQERGDSAREYFENVWQGEKREALGDDFGDAIELMGKCFDCFERMEDE